MSAWVDDDNAALFTDLYQLTMLQAYYLEEMHDEAVFDLFIRRLRARNYLVACGLDTVLHYLETVRFTEAAIAYLDTLGLFRPAFLDHLAAFRFTGDVFAVAEGTPVFADEPILQVVAPLGEAQLVETFVLNQVTFQTGIASKASRVVQAARGRPVADFGMRRMQGADAALKAARAYTLAGVASTSNVLAAQVYGMPPSGTMAHSYVLAHDREEEAFRAFAATYPGTTLLVDTFDTIEGVRRVVDLAKAHGDAFRVGALRLDSGDLAVLSREARQVLDAGGLSHVRLFASNSLDEASITALLDQGAPLDGFGVGTRMGALADIPYLDSVYKLSEYAGVPRMKLSSNKSNVPGRKQLFRFHDGGRATHDVVARSDESLDGEPLLHCVMRGGRRTAAGRVPLSAAAAYARAALAALPDHVLALAPAETPFPVTLSPRLQAYVDETRRALEAR